MCENEPKLCEIVSPESILPFLFASRTSNRSVRPPLGAMPSSLICKLERPVSVTKLTSSRSSVAVTSPLYCRNPVPLFKIPWLIAKRIPLSKSGIAKTGTAIPIPERASHPESW
jgi:hypothetical protein